MSVLRLYPAPHQHLDLRGLYLNLGLHRRSSVHGITIYANFIASLDGRISLRDPQTGAYGVPKAIVNQRDWRLYQELAAQSDVLITSGRYFRQLAEGLAQDELPVARDAAYADLHAWRRQQALKLQPEIAILSASLEIPQQVLDPLLERGISILTCETAPETRIQQFERMGVRVCIAGREQVEPDALRAELIQLGYRSAYMIAGPDVHRTLVGGDVLDDLFLTTRHTLLGGDFFHTLLGGTLPKAVNLSLRELYYDLEGQQMFAHYVRERQIEEGEEHG